MSENDKSPVDRALDLFVFAPLGFALEARRMLPDMIERGRQQVTGQVGMARMMGQFAVQQGQTEAGKVIGSVQKQATTALEELGVLPGQAPPRAPQPESRPPAPTPASAPEPAPPAAPASGDTSRLAIPDYDSLSASQVVPRLAGLAMEELEAVRDYEAAHRGRKTILNRVAQLQAH